MFPRTFGLLAMAAACAPTDGNNNTDDTGTLPGSGLGAKVLVTGLENVFEMVVAPGGDLWVTERTAGRVTRVSVANGATTTLLSDPPGF